MTAEENKEIVRRFFEAGSDGTDYEGVVDEIVAPGYVCHMPPYPDLHGPEGVKEFHARSLSIMPDLREEIEDIIAEGDKVAVRWTLSGTHEGESRLGIAPTGKRISITGTSIMRFEGGKIAEQWAVFDLLGMMQQMGAMPTPEQKQAAT